MYTKKIPTHTITIEALELLASKFYIDDSGCWRWSAARNPDGYGAVGISGHGIFRAHRTMYGLVKGEIEPGLHLDHLCRERSCVNPNHLEPVTSLENTRRGNMVYMRLLRTHCRKGHELSGANVSIRKNPKDKNTHRICRTCDRNKSRVKRARAKLSR